MELKPRIKNGVESDTHFLYVDKNAREWSVMNFEKMMKNVPEYSSKYFGYSWEAMYFGDDKESLDSDQYRGFSAEEVVKQIEDAAH